jgi:hypothetical protein
LSKIEQIIEIHQKVLDLDEAPITIIAELIWFFLAILLIVHLIKDRKTFSPIGLINRILFLCITFLIVGSLFIPIKNYDFSMTENKWEKEYLKPYIMSLPTQKLEVNKFSVALKTPKKGIKSVYLNNNKENPIWCDISSSGQQGSANRLYVLTKIHKENIKMAYLTYKIINKDISDTYRDDLYYEAILHIPKNSSISISN